MRRPGIGRRPTGAQCADLVPVAAPLHRAPSATAGPGGVEEEQVAVGGLAFAEPSGGWPGEHLDGIAGHRGQYGGSGRREQPPRSALGTDLRHEGGSGGGAIDDGEVGRGTRCHPGPADGCPGQPPQRVAQGSTGADVAAGHVEAIPVQSESARAGPRGQIDGGAEGVVPGQIAGATGQQELKEQRAGVETVDRALPRRELHASGRCRSGHVTTIKGVAGSLIRSGVLGEVGVGLLGCWGDVIGPGE